MRIDRSFLNWGVFFVVLGAIPLAVRGGLLAADTVDRWWQLWPLIIVGVGLAIVLRRTPADWVGGLLIATTSGAMLGGAFASSGGFPFGICNDRGGTAFPTQTGRFATVAEADLQLNCGDLTVRTAEGSEWQVAGSTEDGGPPSVAADEGRLQVRTPERRFDLFGGRQSWTVTLPTAPTLDLDVTTNAGSGELGLGGATLRRVSIDANAGSVVVDAVEARDLAELDVSVNAGSATLDLPRLNFSGRLSANAGSLAFCLPSGTALQVSMDDNVAASNNFADQGLSLSGSTWRTEGYATAEVKVDLEIDANAGSVTLNPEDGCRE
jgi:hypothetical protein